MEKRHMSLKKILLEAIPCLFRQSSKPKIMVHLVPNDFQPPQEHKKVFSCVMIKRLMIRNAGTKWLNKNSCHRPKAKSTPWASHIEEPPTYEEQF